MKKKISNLFSWLFIALLILTNGTTKVNAEDKFVFIASGAEPNTFNTTMRMDDAAYVYDQNIFSRLVKLNINNEYIPDLAKEWEYSDDNKTITFKLHENVEWHDGQPFSSEDVKWTYDTLITEKWPKSDTFVNVESIEAPDENTVVFKMKQADASFLSKLSWYGTFILPKHLYEGTDYANNPANMHPIGTGPFKFVSYENGVSLILEKNEKYFGHVPEIDELIFKISSDPKTAYQSLINGEIDYLGGLSPSEANSLDENPDYRVFEYLGINRAYITGNLQDEKFKDGVIMKAIALAIDQQSIFDRVSNNIGQVATTFISPKFADYVNEEVGLPKTNVDEAIKLFEESGYEKNENGHYVELQLDSFEDGNFSDICTVIKANLEKAGIGININMMEFSAWQTKVAEDKNFDLTLLAGYQGPDVSGIEGRISINGFNNLAGYTNEEVENLLKEGVKEVDPEKRIPLYNKVQEIMAQDLPIIPILDYGYKIPLHNNFEGFPEERPDEAGMNEFTFIKRVN
ncbi:ABC transporter substrate-binding protein [Facklamia languida]|uniref:Solute-binding protein family 5 domain-containing protein n=1 Tax=Facklamia languida CCUG 37842 TaxID=883113 RepID=H3NIF8_9LACT|nr:ABC transporter substrate-binding protein [Facklamia languida]EHR37468.1 hypothetical protein HMPREF9708_00647 [Facklamia languida CCUG 37842]